MLLVEDDAAIAGPLSRALQREGYEVDVVGDGQAALHRAGAAGPDLMVLDLGLPGMDGLEVCRRVRVDQPDLPVLMLTARTDEVDFVVGLDAGADDYVGKPFRLAELLARVRALLRRRGRRRLLEAGGVRLEPSGAPGHRRRGRGRAGQQGVRALRVLMAHAGQVVSREEILREVWDDPEMRPRRPSTCTCRGCDASSPTRAARGGGGHRISTVRGVGFRFNT